MDEYGSVFKVSIPPNMNGLVICDPHIAAQVLGPIPVCCAVCMPRSSHKPLMSMLLRINVLHPLKTSR